MYIDESEIKNGITSKLLYKLIEKHQRGNERYSRLQDYYNGKHEILNRTRASKGVANNKVICNHAKYITDMSVAYLVGNAVTYSASEDYNIEPLKNAYLVQNIENTDRQIEKSKTINGKAYELVYASEKSEPRSAYLHPSTAFVVYNNKCSVEKMFGVYYYKRYGIDGNIIGIVCNVYTDNEILTYMADTDNFYAMELRAREKHYFGAVPLIEYRNNQEEMGDYIPLIDAYNVLMSDRVNDKEQFVDSFLFLSGIEIDSEQAKKLKEEHILIGYDNTAKAEYLSKIMAESDVEILRNNLKDDIHRFSAVPDLSDESFGNNLSGVAIKYKLMAFEQMTKNKESELKKGLQERFVLYNNFLCIRGSMEHVPAHRVDIIFTRNLPANELEISQMIANLKGTVSNETLLSQLSFVTDAKEEAKLVRKEKAEIEKANAEAAESRYRTKHSYNVNDDEE